MLTEPTQSKLTAMRLLGMLDAWREQQSTTSANSLSFDERFALIVDAEELHRDTGTEIPAALEYYIDWSALARDMELNGDIMVFETGFEDVHVFWTR